MAFQVHIAGADELSRHRYLTEVRVERPLFGHATAHVVLRWQEGERRYGERQTALTAARVLNCPIEVRWKDNDLAESLECFHGYVEDVRARRDATASWIAIDAVSYSRRTDIVPRHRVFQATTLLDIAEHIARTEPLIRIGHASDLDIPITLSVQHAETDFAYLARMTHAWGVPMVTRDLSGEVILGARGAEASSPFPDVDWGWAEVEFAGHLKNLLDPAAGGVDPTSAARRQVSEFNAQLPRKASVYYGIPDAPRTAQHVSHTRAQVDTSGYRLRAAGMVLPFGPGDVVSLEGQPHLISHARITGHPRQTTADQELWLQPQTLPLAPGRPQPEWPSRALWAYVTDNEHDPLHQARVQVEFEWEHLDPQPSAERAWLHTLTPYGGGAGGARSSGYTGFYSVPEVGERVLVEFLGDWDSEAVVIGGVRQHAVPGGHNQRHTKRWRTPEGNAVALHSEGADHHVRIENRNKIMFLSHVNHSSNSVTVINGSHGQDILHMEREGVRSRVYVSSNNILNISSIDEIHISSARIKITAAEDLQLLAKTVSIGAAEDLSLSAGRNMQIAALKDLDVDAVENMKIEAHENMQVNSDAVMEISAGATLWAKATGEAHLDGSEVDIATQAAAPPLPPPQFPEIPDPPANPPGPTMPPHFF